MIRRPFTIVQDVPALDDHLELRLDHEGYGSISLEIDHPFYDEIQDVALSLESAQDIYDALGVLIEEQKRRSAYVLMKA